MNVEKTAVKMLRNIDFKMPGCCKNCKINSITRCGTRHLINKARQHV